MRHHIKNTTLALNLAALAALAAWTITTGPALDGRWLATAILATTALTQLNNRNCA